MQIRPDYAAAHLTLGNLYRGQGDYARAAGEYEKTVKLQPKDADAHANLGAAYVRLKRVDDGIRELEAALELKPDDYEARVSLGFAYKQKGDYKHAIEHLQKATELKPDDAAGLDEPGRRRSRRPTTSDGAIAAFRKAITIIPDDARAPLQPGRRLQAPAQDATRRSPSTASRSRRTPNYAPAYYDLGVLYSQEKKTVRGPRGVRELPGGTARTKTPPSRKEAEERLKTFKADRKTAMVAHRGSLRSRGQKCSVGSRLRHAK